MLISKALSQTGMDVIYLGKFQTPKMIVKSALQEDVDVICISCLTSNYQQILRVLDLLKEKDRQDIPVIAGGTIPKQHVSELKKAGVNEVFLPGGDLDTIVDYVTSVAKQGWK
jgi:methylmalonyl-CoA mutase C-terminal domain/subunit